VWHESADYQEDFKTVFVEILGKESIKFKKMDPSDGFGLF
jgi:hypothetical protein